MATSYKIPAVDQLPSVGYPWKTLIAGAYMVPKQLAPVEIMMSDANIGPVVRSGERKFQGGYWPPAKVYVVDPADATGTDSVGVPTASLRFPMGKIGQVGANDKLRAGIAFGTIPTVIISGGMGMNLYGRKMVQTATGWKVITAEAAPPAPAHPVTLPKAPPGTPGTPGANGAQDGIIGQIVGGKTAGVPTWALLAGLVGGIWWWRSRR